MDRRALLHQGHAALQAGQAAAATDCFRRLLAASPEDGEARHGLGLALAQQGQLPAALLELETAAAALPRHAEIAFNLALARQLAGDSDGAVASFRRATELAPGHGPAWRNLGTALLAAEAPSGDALPAFEQALRLDPDDAAALLGVGFCHRREGRLQPALVAFRAAQALAPEDRRALANLAGALLDSGQAEACRTLLAGREVTGLPADLAVTLAEADLALDHPAAALAILQAALTRTPGHSRALGHRYLALAAAGAAMPALDDPALVAQAMLPAPPGFADRAAFHAALMAEVLTDPGLRADRAGKTTRGGRQSGNLAQRPGPALAALLAGLQPLIQEYLAGPASAWRPTAPQRWRLVLWATLLEPGGFQDPHNHPSGVASGIYYVRTPDRGGGGTLMLGAAPGRFTGASALPQRAIQPVEGLAVLFPSWLWHATRPTDGAAPRLSLAFDAVPMAS